MTPAPRAKDVASIAVGLSAGDNIESDFAEVGDTRAQAVVAQCVVAILRSAAAGEEGK